ncbi:MAG TPA: S8/S53 family peptidase [Candidatus Thermoplasmatota archaeon]|nr:S8/S53 family peptidase [Candidatus Thermoplasmatota archaeon]
MRKAAACVLVALALLLSGCAAPPPEEAPEETLEPAVEGPEPEEPVSADPPAPPVAPPPPPREPVVVVAHVDTGINPYHAAFRDDSPRAREHPCTYIDGYPCDVPALNLTLNASSYDEALASDRAVWESVQPRQLHWIPGTKIVGAMRWSPGGTNCPAVAPIPPASILSQTCEDLPILDDHGHGTMTASRSAAALHSLAPEARFVSIEGLSGAAVRWIADQGWIDVQTNSWGSLLPHPVPDALGAGIASAFEYAASRMVTLAASGNGLAFFNGFATWPTYLAATMPPGVVIVGAHDNGRATLWHGQPAHVVADAYAGWTALSRSLDEYASHPISCCTSAASPYAAGGAAAIVLEARRILGDTGAGVREGVVAAGPAGRVPDGPLADGVFTLDEFRQVYFRTAQSRPTATEDDGLAHWLSEPRAPDHTEYGPGANPFCQGCWTTPIPYDSVPANVPLVLLLGYGGINVHSLATAREVLHGRAPLPERSMEDGFFALDSTLRGILHGG